MPTSSRRKMQIQWKAHRLIWNLSGGRLGRRVVGMPVLELITTGRATGIDRQILITYVDHEGGPAIIGTNAGMDTDPAWVKNLRSNPRARARWDGSWHNVTAREIDGPERDAIWTAAVAANPGYEDYLATITRPVPIMQLQVR